MKNERKKDITAIKAKRRLWTFRITSIAVFVGICITLLTIIVMNGTQVAKVGKHTITDDEFMYYFAISQKTIFQQYGITQANAAEFLNQDTGQGTVLEAIKSQALSQAASDEVIYAQAKKNGFKPSKEALDVSISEQESILERYSTATGSSLNDAAIQFYGVKLSSLKAIFNKLATNEQFINSELDKMPVEDTELKAFYEENKNTINTASIAHILISCDAEATEDEKNTKKAEAEKILEMVNNNGDFAALAKEYSEDPGSKDNGGVYEIHQDGQMVPEFESWAFENNIGDTGIVQTVHGYHVMLLKDLKNTFEQLNVETKRMYNTPAMQKTISEWVNSDEYAISIKPHFNEIL